MALVRHQNVYYAIAVSKCPNVRRLLCRFSNDCIFLNSIGNKQNDIGLHF